MKKILLLLLFLTLLMIYPNLLRAAGGKIAGSVIDKSTGEPLLGANIFVEGTYMGATTDEEGYYYILNLQPGKYSVTASYIGFGKITKTDVIVKLDQTTQIDFELNPVEIAVEAITVVAERPPVEVDLTASKETMTDDDITKSWGIDIQEVINDLPGVNINGGIRGGFGLNVAYNVDGMDMRDPGSNTNFSTVNLSTIKAVEVMTGGWNAEYGRANGAILNIISKSSSDKLHGSVSYKLRPAGVYHWGTNIYGDETFQKSVMTTREFWDPQSTWQTKWMDAPHAGYSGNYEPFVSMTPEERAAWWKNFINDSEFNPQYDYAKRMEYETETTIYGPLMEGLSFMLSGRFKEGTTRFPSALKYNPEMTIQGSINYQVAQNTKVDITGVYTQFDNSGFSKTNFGSSEDTFHEDSALPFVRSPYDKFAYWLWGSYSSSNFNVRAPEYAKFFNLQAKATHVFSPSTFLEAAVQHSEMNYEMNYRGVMKSAYYTDLGFGTVPDKYPYANLPKYFGSLRWAAPGDIWDNQVNSKSTTFKADLTSQLTKNHQLKTGGIFIMNEFDKILHDHQGSATDMDGHLSDLGPTKSFPYEGAFYLQDKMEFEGMVINAGVRVDFFDPNKMVSANAYDPLMISDSTIGNNGTIGHISYDENGDGPGYVKTPTQWAISPRFGISHPISETTVLHFMYGEFYQRPPWQKISGPVVAEVQLPGPEEGGTSQLNVNPDSVLVNYNFYTHVNPNPALTWEKMTQWEVGIDQNIVDQFMLKLTLYSRDAYDLSSSGIRQGPGSLNISSTGNNLLVEMYGDPYNPSSRTAGKNIGFFETFVNGAWAQVRGIEATIGTRFRYINANLNYTFSFLKTGVYHTNESYLYFPEKNSYSGANNRDSGLNGIDDDSWQPKNSALLRLSLVSPEKFGPEFMGVYPLSGWTINTSTSWAQGRRFTYYSSDVPSGEQVPNNKIWRDKWNTNLSVTKSIGIFNNMILRLSMQVKNLFNDQHLRLPSGGDRTRYFEEGKLPSNDLTKEPLVWSWYSNYPREIYFGMTFEF